MDSYCEKHKRRIQDCYTCWNEKTFDEKYPPPLKCISHIEQHENGEGTIFKVVDANGEKIYTTWDSVIYEFFNESYPALLEENKKLKETLKKIVDEAGVSNDTAIEALKLLKLI